MKIFNSIKIVFGALVISSCQDDVQRQIKSEEVAVNNSNKLSVADSIYFISSSTSANIITVTSDAPDANFYFSVNRGPFKISDKASLVLQKQDSILQYYLAKESFDNSVIKTIMFPKHSTRFLNKVLFSSTLTDSTLKINIVDKSRGILRLEIFTVTGSKLMEHSHSKNTDNLSIHYALENYSPGIYLAVLSYGKDLKTYRILKK